MTALRQTATLAPTLALAAACLCLSGPAATAQALTVEPIQLDVDSPALNASGELLLVAAYQPDDTSPVLDQLLSGRTAIKNEAGRPAPSIIVGRIEAGQEEEFGIEGLMPATVEANRFDYNDLEARRALRESDPELFRKLVIGGHIDPPEEELARALQAELKTLGCYTSTIDGIWGNGSRRSVDRFGQALGDAAANIDREPTNILFRTILLNPGADCGRTAAAPSSSRNTGSSGTRRTQPSRQPAAKKQAPAPKKAAPTLRVVR